MTNMTLWQDYFHRARVRREVLRVLQAHGAHADLVREAQELVELLLKGLLRRAGVDPPKWHDVGKVLEGNIARLPPNIQKELPRMMILSSRLRKERELSFYGDEDFIPSEQYSEADSAWCLIEVDWLLALVSVLDSKATPSS